MGLKTNIPKFEKAAKFEQYLKDSISAKDYENLPDLLDVNGTWFRRLLDNPALMKDKHVIRIAQLLQVEPFVLMEKYGLGAWKMNAMETINHFRNWEKKVSASAVFRSV